ncbi:conserved domain protein [Enterococcus faecalis TX1467]|nr:conserved domain protein [Enterococcus faecalis TX1467]
MSRFDLSLTFFLLPYYFGNAHKKAVCNRFIFSVYTLSMLKNVVISRFLMC